MDRWMQKPELLRGMPKYTIAQYVYQETGIAIPRCYDDFTEAKRFLDNPFIRSEHRIEYDGPSGLLDSLLMRSHDEDYSNCVNSNEIRDLYFKNNIDFSRTIPFKGRTKYEEYCDYAGLNQGDFVEGIRFSFWEHLDGVKAVVVKDSSIENRYHVMFDQSANEWGYIIYENDQIIDHFGSLQYSPVSLVDNYKVVQALDYFEEDHCPVMEFLTQANRNYFLQYHRGRNFKAVDYEIDRSLEREEIDATLVRGASQGEQEYQVVFGHYYENDRFMPDNAFGAFERKEVRLPFNEYMSRRRPLQFCGSIVGRTSSMYLNAVAKGHSSRSLFFKPEISLLVDYSSLLLKGETFHDFATQAREQKRDITRAVRVISDGRRAYIKRL